MLEGLLGRAVGRKLGALAANADPRQVESRRSARSVSAQAALGRRAVTAELLWSSRGYLADRVASRLRAAGRAGRTITVRVRLPPMRSVTRSATLTITEVAVALARAALADHPGEEQITLVTVSVSNLAAEVALQLSSHSRLATTTTASRCRAPSAGSSTGPSTGSRSASGARPWVSPGVALRRGHGAGGLPRAGRG